MPEKRGRPLSSESEHVAVNTRRQQEAAATLLALGVRASPTLDPPRDRFDAQLQQAAIDVNEHNLLYPKAADDKAKKHLNTGLFRRFHAKRPEIPESSSAHSSNRHETDSEPAITESARATTPKNVSDLTNESTLSTSSTSPAPLLELNDTRLFIQGTRATRQSLDHLGSKASNSQ